MTSSISVQTAKGTLTVFSSKKKIDSKNDGQFEKTNHVL